MKQAFNATKEILIQHSFNKVYDSNIINKRKPKVIQHILTSNFVLDLSSTNNLKLKKNIIRAAFQNNFCRELDFFSNNARRAFVKTAKVQTVQFALHCSKGSMNPLEKSLLQRPSVFGASKTPTRLPPWFLNFGVKTSTVPCLLRKKAGFDFLTLNLKLNNLCILYKRKKENPCIPKKGPTRRVFLKSQIKGNLLGSLINKKLTFSLKKPLVFIKVISAVFNKAIKKSSLCNFKIGVKNDESPILTFKKPKKPFLNSKVPLWGSLFFNIGDKNKSSKLKTESKGQIKKQETGAAWFSVLESSSSLVGRKRWSSQTRTMFDQSLFKSGEFFGGSLVRADWVLDKFIEQFSKKKMNPRAAMNQQINDIRILIDKMGSECPIKGIRITITGRLGSRKKAMAQQISKCVGKVPLSVFRQKVDYKQGFLPTRFGLVGIKIWVCYTNNYS